MREKQPRKAGERAGIKWNEVALGRIPDSRLARLLGVSETDVRLARLRRGIPRWDAPAGAVQKALA